MLQQIEGVPEGFEVRCVYDTQGLADAVMNGQKLGEGERVVCAIIRKVSQVCQWPHGVFADGWIAEDESGELWFYTAKPSAADDDAWTLRSCDGEAGKLKNGVLANHPVFREDLPWDQRIQQVGPTIEATLKGGA